MDLYEDYLIDDDSADGGLSPAGTHSHASDEDFYASSSTTPPLSLSASISTSPKGQATSPLESACNIPPHLKMSSPFGPEEVEDDEDELHPPVVMFSVDAVAARVAEVKPDLLLPLSHFDFQEAVCTNNVAWLDKSRIFSDLFGLQYSHHRVPIICRPPGFGKSFVVDMLKTFHDVSTPTKFARGAFEHTAAGPLSRYEHFPCNQAFRSHLVLCFKFRGLDVRSPERWKIELHVMIDCVLRRFIMQYRDILDKDGSKRFAPEAYGSDGLLDLQKALELWLTGAEMPVYLIVDDYDYPQRASNGDNAITDIMLYDFIEPLRQIRKAFAKRSVFFGRENPRDLAQRSGNRDIWCGIGVDRSRDFQIESSFGLTKAEVRELCRVLGLAGVERQIYKSFPSHWCRELYGDMSLYCTKDVMAFLAKEQRQISQ